MGGHGEGHVAVPARIAADLVVVQAALLFGGLEALLHRPAAAGDADQLIQGGVGGTVGDVVGALPLARTPWWRAGGQALRAGTTVGVLRARLRSDGDERA